MSTCKSCGAPVKWARTEAGKNMPLDVDPDTGGLAIFEDGNVAVTGWVGPLRTIKVVAVGAAAHRSHFASCPNAGGHRK